MTAAGTRGGHGTWDPTARPVYFFAGSVAEPFVLANLDHRLIAVNDLVIDPDGSCQEIETMLEAGLHVLVDSGIFWLTNEHKRTHGLTMDDALALPPSEIDGFDDLFDDYVALLSRYGDDVWGYIELDQGGATNKRKTRKRLHDLGLDPMPVYHPLNDGSDYLDELFEGFDRMCMGNVVQADRPTRLRLIHALWERHRQHPDVWVHLLGFTPNTMSLALAFDSCDSSTWLRGVRWAASTRASSMLNPAGRIGPDLWPQSVTDRPEHRFVSIGLGVNEAKVGMRTLLAWQQEVEETLGLDPYATTIPTT